MNQQKIIGILAVVFSAISIIASICIIYLIRVSGAQNAFMAIIFYMSCCQLVYDASFAVFFVTNQSELEDLIWYALQGFGGLSVSSDAVLMIPFQNSTNTL